MKRILALVVIAVALASAAGPARGATRVTLDADPDAAGRNAIVKRAVSFRVDNHNRSATAAVCRGDGESYTIRGSLVGPIGVEAARIKTVTVYVHGSGDGSTWHFTAVPGVDHITEMARLGHTSVFLHLLGFGHSDPVDGNGVCFGTYADHVQQVIAQLRAGTYTMHGGSPPMFGRVALAGHSAGGLVAELTQVSFGAADALVVAGWTDYALGAGIADVLDTPGVFPYTTVAGFAQRCATAPESKWPQGPGGWAFFFTTRAEVEMLVHDVAPEVLDAFIDHYEQDPCGWGRDFPAGSAANIAATSSVDVPVLLANGDRDPIAPPAAVELQRARYAVTNDDVSSLVVPETGHQIMFEHSAPAFRSALSSWLERRGF